MSFKILLNQCLIATLFILATTSISLAASISGVVKDNNGISIGDIGVSLLKKNGNYWVSAGYIWNTESDGSYTFNDLAVNEYKVKTIFASSHVNEYYNNVNNEADALIIEITSAADAITGINFNLDALGKISGTVRDLSGQIITNTLEVKCYKYNDVAGNWEIARHDIIYSNENGQYSLVNLKSGTYRVRFGDFLFGNNNGNVYDGEFYDNAHTLESSTDITISVNQEEVIDVVLGDLQTGTITGTLLDSLNQAIQDASVVLYRKEFGEWIFAGEYTVESDGSYSFNKLLANEYLVRSFAKNAGYVDEYYGDSVNQNGATPIVLPVGENRSGIDIELDKLGSISGIVRNQNGDIITPNIDLYIKLEDGRWVENAGAFQDSLSGGVYLSVLPGEQYRLLFSELSTNHYEFYDDAGLFDNATDIIVPLNQERTINVVLGNVEYGSVSGIVTDINNQPVPNAQIELTQNNGNYWGSRSASTDSNGRYTIDHLFMGDYQIHVGRYQYIGEYYNNAPDISTADLITVTSNEAVENINFQLDKLGVIKGTIRNSNGENLTNALVILFMKIEDGSWIDINQTYSYEGSYSFNYLKPGPNYRLKFYNSGYFEFYSKKTTLGDAVDIVILPNDIKIINVVLGINLNVINRAELSREVLLAKYGLDYIPPVATGMVFTDVQQNDYNADWIEKLSIDAITEGCSATRFCPNMTVTKEQLSQILLKVKFGASYTPPVASGSLFSDVFDNDFAADWIEGLVNQGITEGCDVNKFCPKQAVTFESFEKMLDKALP